MPQLQLPTFPIGVTPITSILGILKEDNNITYFYGSLPVFSHTEEDKDSFRMITAQFCASGHTKQIEIARAFGVTSISVKRSVKLYRAEGARGFYKPKIRRGAAILTLSVLKQAQQLLSEHEEVADVALKLNIKPDTLSKARTRDGVYTHTHQAKHIQSGQALHEQGGPNPQSCPNTLLAARWCPTS